VDQPNNIGTDPLTIALASLTISMVFCRTLIDRGILRPSQVSSLCHEAAQSLLRDSEPHTRDAAAIVEEIRKRLVQDPAADLS
jgi:hypothetical protein